MSDPARDLARFLADNGVDDWVLDDLGGTVRLDDWIVDFIDTVLATSAEVDATERLAALRALLDDRERTSTAKKGTVSISVRKVREVLTN
ncbi:hypothetical protein GCM10010174_25890 [Kutzneria viridogrisea]|uniref:Uncharacterized protein n=1 Tax=Kutzneria viridogrisea TaxID=47990 RepID=A0ABR6BSH2_9PSEU|nr:hypothetical protein [Kutzneria viridogrisea]